jgi:hypothetical protein
MNTTRTNMTLREWEATLRQQVGEGDVLIGQLPLDQSPYDEMDMRQLGMLLASQIQLHGSSKALEIVERHYSLALALYLVLQGIYNYQGGTYWPAVAEQLGLEGNSLAECGRAFRRILKKYHLPTFQHIQGHKNLVPILAHGGIPNYSIGDFFSLLQKSMKDSLIALDAETLIEDWAADPEDTFVNIDRPVQRFILHGGSVAEDFLTRCLALLEADSDDEISYLTLPQRVVDGYQIWQEEQAETRYARARIRLTRPVLYLDPYGGEGVCIEFRPQKFPAGRAFSNLIWVLEAGERQREVVTDRERTADGYEFTVPDIVHVPAASQYKVSLQNEDGLLRSWNLDGVGEFSLMMFDPDTGNRLNEREWLHAGERWILYPVQYELAVSKGRKTGQLPQQYGEWSKYAIEEWDVAPGSVLRLTGPEGLMPEIRILDEIALRRPHFVGGDQPLDRHLRSRFPLYSGSPPQLAISFRQRPNESQLGRWRITARAEGPARPPEQRSYLLSELRPWFTIDEENQLLLDLGEPQLLGSEPCGKFEINAQGPFGRGRRLGLRIVPKLRVEGQQRLYLSAEDGPAELKLQVDDGSRIQNLSPQGVICEPVTGQKGQYSVKINPAVHMAKFAFIDEDEIRVNFTVLVRRLRWALCRSGDQERLAWQSEPLRIFPRALDDIYETELSVDLPTLAGGATIVGGWRLVNSEGIVQAERQPDLERSRQQFGIRLGELMPSFRVAQAEGDLLCLQIWLYIQHEERQEKYVNALYLTPRLDLGDIRAEWEELEDEIHLALHWTRPHPCRNLNLYLWPADQPWIEEGLILPISDSNSGQAKWRRSPTVLPGTAEYGGLYIANLVIADPWSSERPQRPDPQHPATIVFKPPLAELYYGVLELDVQGAGASPMTALAALAYQHRTQQYNKMYDTNRELRQLSKEFGLDVDQMLLWADLVRDLDDPTAYKLVQMSLFSEESVTQLETTSPGVHVLDRYLAHLPEQSLDPRAYMRLLIAGFPQVRRQCIAALCRKEETSGLDELLADVQAGKLLVSEAAEILTPVYDFAADYLMQCGTADAQDVLYTLTKTAGRNPTWIEPEYLLETNIGSGQVLTIRESASGQLRGRCWLWEDCQLVMRMVPPTEPIKAYVQLAAKKIEFETICVYQCSLCGEVSGSTRQSLDDHHVRRHAADSPVFRVRKPPVFELTQLGIRLPVEGGKDEPASY